MLALLAMRIATQVIVPDIGMCICETPTTCILYIKCITCMHRAFGDTCSNLYHDPSGDIFQPRLCLRRTYLYSPIGLQCAPTCTHSQYSSQMYNPVQAGEEYLFAITLTVNWINHQHCTQRVCTCGMATENQPSCAQGGV